MDRDAERARALAESTLSTRESGAPAPPPIVLARGASLGRYIVLQQLGNGGMGVVYSAYDPELDRKLAVKVLRPEAAGAQARLQREARAMARVQHPNVITVHDVGTFEDRVFVAMELVDGATLSHWLAERPRPWRAVLDVFVQAGRGLAAAHAAGVVHRDFKPSNVLVGRDGRVRVVDFGLARSVAADPEPPEPAADVPAALSALEPLTRTGALAGTPPYMSPEQLLGQPVDARSDQFSFCVALYRALFGQRPFSGDDPAALAEAVKQGRIEPPPRDSRVPGRVRDAVMRGLAVRPDARWPTMDALLAALAHDPAHARRRWLLGGAAAAGIAALGVGYRVARRDALVCSGAARKLAGTWDPARRDAVHAAFVATGKPYAEEAFGAVSRALDAYAGAWAARRTEACEATRVRREQSEELLDLRMECLDQRLAETRAQVDLLAHADGKIVERATRMTSQLPSLAECSDTATLRQPVRPPADADGRAHVARLRQTLARARALQKASKLRDALTLLTPAAAEARALGYRPLEAQALLSLGYTQRALGDLPQAEATLLDAAFAARAGRDGVSEVNAWAELVHVAAGRAHYADGRRWARYAQAAFESLHTTDERPLGRLLEDIGILEADAGRYEEALRADRRALAIREKAYGPTDPTLAGSLEAMARVLGNLGRFQEAEQEIRRALGILEHRVSPSDPMLGSVLFNLGYVLAGQGRDEESLAAYRRNVAIWEKSLGAENPTLALSLNNIADLLAKHGHYQEARVYLERSLAIAKKANGERHPDVGLALFNIGDLLRRQRHADEALAYFRRALDIWQAAFGPDSKHPYLVAALTGIGQAELDRAHPARALAPLERALAITLAQPGDPTMQAETRLALARALWRTEGDRGRARTLARQARDAWAAAGHHDAERATADAWLAAHR